MAASPGPNWRTRVKNVLPEFAIEPALRIAVDHLPETLNVPVSTRYKPGEVAMLNLAPMPDADPA